ncbi:MAG: M56 family metallopeptidase [Sedimentibacter sp.]
MRGSRAYIWVLGIIALLAYSLVSILIIKRQLKSAQLIEKNIFKAKNLKTPFVLGLIRPKIYLPIGLNGTERSYIFLHEQTHIHRKDHIIKKPYANSLLSLATGRHILNRSPLAFGERNVKGRIKNVLNYKKPRSWVIFFQL